MAKNNISLPLEQKLLGTCAVCKKQLVFEIKGSLLVPGDCVVMSTGINVGIAHEKCAAKISKKQKPAQAQPPSMYG